MAHEDAGRGLPAVGADAYRGDMARMAGLAVVVCAVLVTARTMVHASGSLRLDLLKRSRDALVA
jgi:hypothetical protein